MQKKLRYVTGNLPNTVHFKFEETLDDGARQVIDLVHNQQLCETSYAKKDYMAHIKNYMKILADLVPADQKDDFQKNAQAYVKEVLGGFDDYCLYAYHHIGCLFYFHF